MCIYIYIYIYICWQTGLDKRGSSKMPINPPYKVLNCIIWFGGRPSQRQDALCRAIRPVSPTLVDISWTSIGIKPVSPLIRHIQLGYSPPRSGGCPSQH